MARKRRKRKKSAALEHRRLTMEALHRGIREHRQGGKLRAALEMAKEACRRERTPEHASLLADLYHDRARELAAKGLHTEAMTVLGHALSLGAGDAALLRLAFECGLRSGDYAGAADALKRVRDPAERDRAQRLAADHAVLNGGAANRLCDPETREDADRIRRAFAAFERGDDAAVTAELKPIGLRSACASWKWLLRGLMAHARDDVPNARAGWTRIERDGQAGCAARALLSTLPEHNASAESDAAISPVAREAVLKHLGDPRVEMLRQLKRALAEGDDSSALKVCERLLAAVEPEARDAYKRRLARAVCTQLDWDPDTARRFRRVFGGFGEDPRFLRLIALDWEEEDPFEAAATWEHYIEDLRRGDGSLPPALCDRAEALIWQRMGDQAQALPSRAVEFYRLVYPGAPSNSLDAVDCYERSIKLWPELRESHERYLEYLCGRKQFRRAEVLAERILARWPTHIDSLLFLGTECFRRNAFRKALKYLEQARTAEPFNPEIRDKMKDCLLFSARRRLDKGNLTPARRDYAQAETLYVPGDSRVELYCKWAALEWRAGDAVRAEALFARAMDAAEPAPATEYQMAVEANRAPAPPAVQAELEARLEQAWHDKPTAEGTARAAKLTLALHEADVRYPHQATHEAAITGYLRRAGKKLTFSEEQLRTVCRCLEALDAWPLLKSYAKQGARQCPNNYYFPLLLGRSYACRNKTVPFRVRMRLGKAAGQAAKARDMEAVLEIQSLVSGESSHSFGLPMPGSLPDVEQLLKVILGAEADGEADDDDSPQPRRRRPRPSEEPLLFDDLYAPKREDA